MSTEQSQTDREHLVDKYRPLGLRALVAALTIKKPTAARTPPTERNRELMSPGFNMPSED